MTQHIIAQIDCDSLFANTKGRATPDECREVWSPSTIYVCEKTPGRPYVFSVTCGEPDPDIEIGDRLVARHTQNGRKYELGKVVYILSPKLRPSRYTKNIKARRVWVWK
jgi:hypothetical protein